ncbi:MULTISPECIES: hypothetical protein [Burkholderia]|jgi:hypothetical protein|uniref:Uncharacterized protein n=3 Tax=Bacteria TaxID=2 RepID=A0A1E3FQ24_9BURK|nr:hypothetical protein [Burkholderia contaminans]ELK7724895.1 hypothetical protein [Burkholderia cenocepacia]UTP27887.1 hypothetical protein NMB33_40330 [Burkholderia sp. FXe9]HBN6128840.1 hypothetical protein [Clostridioides difficile]MBA9833395.1 hypothetical protein [Burkholderia contaminans]MBH9693766.1 hypothetical protein [Burkholderia contaminans]
MQIGFDFGDTGAVKEVRPSPVWKPARPSLREWGRLLDDAKRAVQLLPYVERAIFSACIEAARTHRGDEIERSMTRAKTDAEREALMNGDVWSPHSCTTVEATDEARANLMRHCVTRAESGQDVPGIEYKTRHDENVKGGAIHAVGVGTVIVREWCSVGVGSITFEPSRSTFFLASFRDDMPAHYAPASLWRPAYCADKIAFSNDTAPSVPTFLFNGREYVNTGSVSISGRESCTAWSIAPLDGWSEQTYNYRSKCAAYDRYEKERGDSRGMVVKVRGQLCVLDKPICFFDDNVTHNYSFIDEKEDGEAEQDDAVNYDDRIEEDADLLAA